MAAPTENAQITRYARDERAPLVLWIGIPERIVLVKCECGRGEVASGSPGGLRCWVRSVGVWCGSRGPCSGHPGEGEADRVRLPGHPSATHHRGWWHGAFRPQSGWAQSLNSTRHQVGVMPIAELAP
jgi:hypothetical protein